ncbi:MAG TPA: CRISPR-associated endoribonuclease Cas6, partial [Pyrodictium sp.]|nr:CRISPR-associated endoribonuclease Cas6 [Pyrodictium sp.]
MIIRIKLKAREQTVLLPKSYNHILQAFFYKNMDPYISKFLHD